MTQAQGLAPGSESALLEDGADSQLSMSLMWRALNTLLKVHFLSHGQVENRWSSLPESYVFSHKGQLEGTMKLGFQTCQVRLGGNSVGRMFA